MCISQEKNIFKKNTPLWEWEIKQQQKFPFVWSHLQGFFLMGIMTSEETWRWAFSSPVIISIYSAERFHFGTWGPTLNDHVLQSDSLGNGFYGQQNKKGSQETGLLAVLWPGHKGVSCCTGPSPVHELVWVHWPWTWQGGLCTHSCSPGSSRGGSLTHNVPSPAIFLEYTKILYVTDSNEGGL